MKAVTLTRSSLSQLVADQCGIEYKDAYRILNVTLGNISETIAKGDRVELRDFGTFRTKAVSQRIRRNPNDNSEKIAVPSHKKLIFRPAKQLDSLVILLPV